jgi:multidrug efflux pump
MTRHNVSEWALRHQAFTGFLIVLLMLGGLFAYFRLGQKEDPEFTFRVMVVKTLYPGASAREVEEQVTDRLEQKLQELPYLDYLRSYSKAGESVILVTPRQDVPPREIQVLWYQARKKLGDIRPTLPQGVLGPFFNDEFGDTYTSVFAFSAEGFSYAELKDYVESARQQLLRVAHVEKVDLIGTQDEKIYVEFSDKKLAQLGLDAQQVAAALRGQNAVTASGTLYTPLRHVPLRLSGRFASLESIRDLPLRVSGATFKVSDIAEVRRGYVDPPDFKMHFNGREVIGLGITMSKAGDVLQIGKQLDAAIARIREELPVGIEVEQVADQPRVVRGAIAEFMRTFGEAVSIVLIVSFLSLGARAGAVVALTVPLVLAGTFLVMLVFGIDFQRISLGALVLALGLLVDDAMIVIEMMARKLDEGLDRIKAATFAYASTSFPMLTGTLITVAGFLPVGLARSSAGEYTASLFQVVGISLLLSWVGAVLFSPFLGYRLLKPRPHAASHHDLFATPFYQWLRRAIVWCVAHRAVVIAGTVILFVGSIVAFANVPKQFFPLSNRPELIVDLWLPEGASFAQSEAVAKQMETVLAADEDVLHYATYVGAGTPRFFLLINQQLANTNLAEIVVMTKDNEAREHVRQRLLEQLATNFPGVRGRVNRLAVGPPADYPILFRVVGDDPLRLRPIADEVAEIVRHHPSTIDVNDDWHERRPAIALALDQDKARALGVTSESLAQALQAQYTGSTAGQYREGNELIDIVWRAKREAHTGPLADVVVRTEAGRTVPLSQLVRLELSFEDGVIWRRNRFPAITVRADLADGVQAPDVARAILRDLQPVIERLPAGYFIEPGGPLEDSGIAQGSIFVWLPLVLVATLLLLMTQLHSVRRTLLVLVTAPLGLIGAAFALLMFGAPFGFVALLGLIALAGMIMRNAVILVDQIEQDERAGADAWTAIVESTVRRFRPIVLTAAAAILAMIPLSRSDFFGPQAITILGGLFIATLLTVFFLPALYAAWFRVRRTTQAASAMRDQRDGSPALPSGEAV